MGFNFSKIMMVLLVLSKGKSSQKLFHFMFLLFLKLLFLKKFKLIDLKREKATMQNDAGDHVDLYVPRKCSSSSRIIAAKDHAAIQLDIVDVDPSTGRMIPGKTTRYAICGKLRFMGESDNCIHRLAQRDGIIPAKM